MMDCYESEMRRQIENQLKVKWIYYKEILTIEGLREFQNDFQARSIDFQIFDGTRLVIWDLDKNTRRHLGGWKSESKAECEKYRNIFQELWCKCHPYSRETGSTEFEAVFRRVADG